MTDFSIENFAKDCKAAMHNKQNRELAAKQFLQHTMNQTDLTEIIDALEAAIPNGANIGEMIVHTSPELTMLYARVPPRFQSGIHNHTVFACIGQLTGSEISTLYKKNTGHNGLKVAGTLTSHAGEVISLPEDAIHYIENPHNETSRSLHLYGGDFNAVMEERSLWDFDDHHEKAFNFQELIIESIKGMKRNDNQIGLQAVAKAIPATRPLIEA